MRLPSTHERKDARRRSHDDAESYMRVYGGDAVPTLRRKIAAHRLLSYHGLPYRLALRELGRRFPGR